MLYNHINHKHYTYTITQADSNTGDSVVHV